MIQNYGYIPTIALLCYGFLFLTLMAAKKNKIITSFLFVLAAMTLWTGGSMGMRMELWPSTKTWYDISIIGLTLMPYSFFIFSCEFVERGKGISHVIWGILILSINVLNITKEVFLKVPYKEVVANGSTAFIYDIQWPVVFLYGLCVAIGIHAVMVLLSYSQKKDGLHKNLTPIIMGIVILLLGHIGFMLPAFKGFPIDILAGTLNAFLLFYAIYQRRLFKLTLLVSKSCCYAISALIAVALFSNIITPLEQIITIHYKVFAKNKTLVIALAFTGATFVIYYLMKKFIDRVFVKNEMTRSENIRKFSLAVSNSLIIDDILDELVTVIQECIAVKKVYVSLLDETKQEFIIAHSTSPLDKRTYSLKLDNPVVEWLMKHDGCLMMKDFTCTVAYKSMWNNEKHLLQQLHVECFMPLKDEGTLVGIVMLTGKQKSENFTYDDVNLLESISSIATIAVKNSRLYKQVYLEARTDELTGLLNRKCFLEVLQQEYEKNKATSLTLIMLSIDDFKLYNQLYGNKEGDVALQNVANIISASVGEHGHVARYSGKKFAIILPTYDVLAAKVMAETISKQIINMNRRSIEYSLKALTASCGICSIPYGAANVRQLVENADMAVYQVKRSGKNAIMVYAMGEASVVQQKEKTINYKEDIYSNYASTIYALTATIDTKDHYTFNHSKNVAYYAAELAFAYGMNEESIEIIREAGLLHDIGKIGIDEQILNKPGRLTEEEYSIMKSHVENSISIIRHLPSLDYVIPAVIGHHERYDGTGYPRRISGEDIPVSARILCIADSFDAMISRRSYKQAFSVEYALEVLLQEAGKQFDPELATLFVKLVRKDTIIPIIEEEIEEETQEEVG